MHLLNRLLQSSLPLLLVSFALGGGSYWLSHSLLNQPANSQLAPRQPLQSSGPIKLNTAENKTIDIYGKVSPAVVSITSTTVKLDMFLNPTPKKGMGSGIILTPDGYILTNAHVVNGTNRLDVSLLGDDQLYEARLVGGDINNDIALLKMDPRPDGKPFPTVPIGNSWSLAVGQKVLAIGNPFGLSSTLTTGIISSLGRQLPTENGRVIENVIQTDAAINPGNSGGALLDSSGRLIGVNTAIYSPSGTSSGIGFAVPIDTALRIVNDLIEHGRLIRPYLGLNISLEVTPRLAHLLKLPVKRGLMVGQVGQDSPAALSQISGGSKVIQAGRRQVIIGGDIITHLDERPVQTSNHLLNAIEQKHPGDTITLRVVKPDGSLVNQQVTLGERGQ